MTREGSVCWTVQTSFDRKRGFQFFPTAHLWLFVRLFLFSRYRLALFRNSSAKPAPRRVYRFNLPWGQTLCQGLLPAIFLSFLVCLLFNNGLRKEKKVHYLNTVLTFILTSVQRSFFFSYQSHIRVSSLQKSPIPSSRSCLCVRILDVVSPISNLEKLSCPCILTIIFEKVKLWNEWPPDWATVFILFKILN